jgi:hypothetical protein
MQNALADYFSLRDYGALRCKITTPVFVNVFLLTEAGRLAEYRDK